MNKKLSCILVVFGALPTLTFADDTHATRVTVATEAALPDPEAMVRGALFPVGQ